MSVDYDAAYIARLEESVLDRIELELGQDPQIVKLRTTGLILADELTQWATRVRKGLRGSHIGTVLDVGCGLGAFSRYVSGVNQTALVGIDLSRLAVEAARLATATEVNATFLVRAAHETGLPPSSIGAVTALDVFHLIQSPDVLSNEIARIVAPSGNLTATTYTSTNDPPDRWVTALREGGFRDVVARDVTAPWKSWMYRRHQLRLERCGELKVELGVHAAGYLALARHLVGGGQKPGVLDTMSRWWLEADR